VIESAAMLCLVAALASSALLFRARRQLWDARAVGAILETVPLEWFRWPAERASADTNDKAPGYRDFLARLLADDALQLEKARLALQSDGIPFSATFVARSGAGYAVEGRRTASGEDVLWLLDASAAVTAKNSRREAAVLRQMLDAIPLPVWRRGPNRDLRDCNRAYANAVDTTPDLAIAEGRELAPGACHGECRHVVIAGSRRLVEIGEVSCPSGGTVGFTCDRTDLEV